MKVLVMSSHTPSLFWFRMEMMQTFQKRGHTVVAVGDQPVSEWKDKFAEQNIEYRQAIIQRNGTNPVKDFKTLLSLLKIIRQEKPNKIFAYQAKTVIYGAIAARLLRCKEIYPLIAGIGSVFMPKDLKAKIIRFVLCMEYRLALKKCPAVFFQNNDDVDVFRRNRIIKKQQIVLLRGSGVNINRFQQQSLPKGTAFLCIARLIKDKGVIEYLEACKTVKALHPEVRCLLVGPFDTNPSAVKEEELAPYLQSGIVEYFGEQADVLPFLKECTVFVLPSYREGTPKTVLEAMACGRAVITTDAPGCRETVIDGENGFLVPVKNVSAIVEKMERFIEKNDLAYVMGAKGRKMAEEQFDVNRVNQTIINSMGL